MQFFEFTKQSWQQTHRGAVDSANAQRRVFCPGKSPDVEFGGRDLFEDRSCVAIENDPRLGQRDMPRRSGQEARSKILFKHLDLTT